MLSEQETATSKNTDRKLEFLVAVKVVDSYNEKQVVINKASKDTVLDATQFFVALREHLVKPMELLRFISKEKTTSYKAIETRFKNLASESKKYRTSVHWMRDLGFVDVRSNPAKIKIKPKGQKLLESMSKPTSSVSSA